MKRSLVLAMTVAVAALVAGCSNSGASFDRDSQTGPDPVLPAPHQYLVPPMHVAKALGWKSGETPSVASGLRIQAIATGLEHPRQPYVLPNGDILVAESNGPGTEPIERPKDFIMGLVQKFAGAGAKGGNRITLLRDTNGDGVPDQHTVLVDHLYSPFGMAYADGNLYVANTDAIVRFPFTPGQTKITASGTVLTALPGGPIDHHWTKSMTLGPDGKTLFVGIGSNSNITENGLDAEQDRARIWQVDRATGAHRAYATGLRNPNGLTINPQTNELWAVVNERDELGPNLVPDYMTSVKFGAFYGWPYSYYGQHVDPRVRPQRPDMVAKAIPPDYALSSHVAPLGMVFYTGSNLPAAFRNGAFVGEHGSWDRGQFNGYRVVFIRFEGGHPVGKPQTIVNGFLNGDGEARGRPVGLAVDQQGGLLIADDLGDTLWRVTSAER